MNWAALATIAEVASAIAVVISLIYVAVQIRQNTISQQGATHHQFLSTQTAANQTISGSAEVCALIDKANEDFSSITSAEQIRLMFVYYDHINQWEFAFDSRKHSLLEQEVWGKINSGYTLFASMTPSFGEVWSLVSKGYDREFKDHVDTVMAGLESQQTTDSDNAA